MATLRREGRDVKAKETAKGIQSSTPNLSHVYAAVHEGHVTPEEAINLNSKFNAKNFQAYNESLKSNALNAKQIMRIDGGEVLDCALAAIGADALFAFGGSTATAWTAAAVTKAFSAVAKRFLGPVGVAIAVVSFGICISHESLD
jgi:hypothetical protein